MKNLPTFESFNSYSLNERKIMFAHQAEIMVAADVHSDESIISKNFDEKLASAGLRTQLDLIKFLGSTMKPQPRIMFIKKIWTHLDDDSREVIIKKSGLI